MSTDTNASTKQPSLLVVDDNAANRMALRVLLGELDVPIIEADSGNQALAVCLEKAEELALILLDIQMPEMDGYEAAHLLRSEEQTRDIPIIFLTAVYKDRSHQVQAYDAGAVDYVEKPVDDHILLSKAKVFLRLWRQNQELHQVVDQLANMNLELQAQTARLQQAEDRLKFMSHHDPLTQLANRNLLDQIFQKSVARLKRSNGKAAFLFLDLDRFKPINDQYGHEVGDAVLVELGMRLRQCVREMDMPARFGGDEFVVLLDEVTDRAEVEEIAKRIVDEIHAPIDWQDGDIQVGVSIGIAIYPDDGDSQHSLMLAADKAMYVAKGEQGNCYRFHADLA